MSLSTLWATTPQSFYFLLQFQKRSIYWRKKKNEWNATRTFDVSDQPTYPANRSLVLCVTSIENELVHSFKTPLNIVTCEPLSTLLNVVTAHWTTPKNPDIGLLLRLNHVGRDKICTGRCPGDKDPQTAPQIGYKFKQPTPSALNCWRCNCEYCQIG